MKLIVQIPCYNEEATLRETVASIPRIIPGLDVIEVLVIDDGSTDSTTEVARAVGVEHIVRHKTNKGLAQAFFTGLNTCLSLGADIVVNTDGDNQYCGHEIARLVRPILDGEADIVIGDRQVATVPHFSPGKRYLQRVGSWLVRKISGVNVPDAVSGFRAMSREAVFQINIVSSFSYTIEMLIQAGKKKLSVASVRIKTNPPTRKSRLFSSIPSFIQRSASTALRVYTMYKPLRTFLLIGGFVTAAGLIPIVRFLYFYSIGQGQGHIQSIVLGGALWVIGLTIFLIGLVADLIAFNRQLVEMTLEKVRQIELRLGQEAVSNVDVAEQKAYGGEIESNVEKRNAELMN